MRRILFAAALCLPAASQGSAATADASAAALRALTSYLTAGGSAAGAATRPFAETPLAAPDARAASRALRDARAEELRRERKDEAEGRYVERDGVRMKYAFRTFGERAGGRSLWISLHGGGSMPADVNDGQWRNQQRLYRPAEGVYLAPRAPTDAWNMWHQPHMDGLLDRLIATMVATEGVDPDRVYLTGYSAGGDGVFRLAPRLADRFAAAAMMAGHPGEASPTNLRNLPFAIYMGGKDAAFERNARAAEWKESLGRLAAADPGGYAHRVEILADKGHWMDGEDAAALPWMAERTRNVRPAKVVWRQDGRGADFYWLGVDAPRAGATVVAEARDRRTVSVQVGEGPLGRLRLRLDDGLVDLDRELTVEVAGRTAFRGVVPRTIAALARSLARRDDLGAPFPAEVAVDA